MRAGIWLNYLASFDISLIAPCFILKFRAMAAEGSTVWEPIIRWLGWLLLPHRARQGVWNSQHVPPLITQTTPLMDTAGCLKRLGMGNILTGLHHGLKRGSRTLMNLCGTDQELQLPGRFSVLCSVWELQVGSWNGCVVQEDPRVTWQSGSFHPLNVLPLCYEEILKQLPSPPLLLQHVWIIASGADISGDLRVGLKLSWMVSCWKESLLSAGIWRTGTERWKASQTHYWPLLFTSWQGPCRGERHAYIHIPWK